MAASHTTAIDGVIAMSDASGWRDDLDRWLQPFLLVCVASALRAMCPLYVAGLIGWVIARASSQGRPGRWGFLRPAAPLHRGRDLG